ncbi:polymer-forming cytoskeletal protein [Desemzia sp. FAM 24101]|uniref:bactofilin family protein n=1 Tax=unclassified Desemzia TaxID=2685243 RepID=UPI003889FCC3
MKKSRYSRQISLRLFYLLSLIFITLPFFSLHVLAQNMNGAGNSTELLDQSETLDGPGFFSGDDVQIDGTVEGTTFAVGEEVHINGTINGSLFVVAQTIFINGEVTGNIYATGQNITITAQSRQDVFLVGANIIIDSQAQIVRDLFVAAASLMQEGTISRHLYGGGQRFTLNGSVAGNAYLDIQQLTLQSSAVIDGNLHYESPNAAVVNSTATINGTTDWEESTQTMSNRSTRPMARAVKILIGFLWSVLSTLIVWFMIKLWRPNFWMHSIQSISTAPLKTIAIGLVTMILTPIAAILSMWTIIGIPFGLILIVTYTILVYLSHIVTAVFIGFWLVNTFKWHKLKNEIWLILLGVLLLELIGLVPFIRFIIGLIVILTGLGALVLSNRKLSSSNEL